LLIFTNITYLQFFNQLVANNKQVVAASTASSSSNLGVADAMHQTTLMQCFNPPHLALTMLPDGYQTFVIDGKKYLTSDKRNHLMIVPTVTASVTAQRITHQLTS
jgi:hypothetical protein